jgi:hypothetical protein
MILQTWLQQLKLANTEAEVVAFARSQLARIRGAGSGSPLGGHSLADGEDVREIASELARAQVPASNYAEAEAMQQLLLLFSLSTDRLTQLDGRGVVNLPGTVPASGGRQQRP